MHELIKQAIRGDTEAFIKLIDENTLAMYKVARGMLKNDDDIADAIQETILHCYEKIGTVQKPQYFRTWMIRILINECNNMLRLSKREYTPDEMWDAQWTEQSYEEVEFKYMLEQVDEKYRVILILYYEEGFKIREIAKILDLNENSVKTRLGRAREQLKDMYCMDEKEKIHTKMQKLWNV